jgi:peptide/nickel transport system substrate-binding protein
MGRGSRRTLRWFSVVVPLLVAVSACSGTSATSDSVPVGSTVPPALPVTGGALSVGIIGSPDGFSPSNNRFSSATTMVAKAIYDPLVTVGADGLPQPYLAESMTPNSDFTVWTIKVRPGITFHDGSPLDANALKLNLEALPKGLVSGPAAREIVSADVVDPLTVALHLRGPNAHVPLNFTGQPGFIVAPAQIAANDPNVLIGTGPFKFQDQVRDSVIDVVRNDSYWRKDAQGNQLPYLASIAFKEIPDGASRSSALQAGDIDVSQTSSPNTVAAASEGSLPGGEQSDLGTSSVDKQTLVLNNLAGAFTDPQLRIAANEAINRQDLINTLLKPDLYKPALGPMSDGSPWGNPKMPGYDPDGAKQLVAAAGGGQPVTATLTIVGGDAEGAALAQFLQQQLNAVGFDIKIDAVELGTFSAGLVTAKADMYLIPLWTDVDPDADQPFFVSTNAPDPGAIGLNFARWRNAKVDDAMNGARRSPDESFRKQQYQIVWDEMAKDAPYVFLYQNVWGMLWQPRVYNIGHMTTPDGVAMPTSVLGSTFLTNVWIQAP